MKNRNMVIRLKQKPKPTYGTLTLKMIEDYLMEAFYGKQSEPKDRKITIWYTGDPEVHMEMLNKAMKEEMERLRLTDKQD